MSDQKDKKSEAEHIELGRRGEMAALHHLQQAEFEILEQNWRDGRAEIDIICRKDKIIIFVEVKTRSSQAFGAPELSITKRKQNLMVDAAQVYCETINHDGEIRFDVISVVFLDHSNTKQLNHYEDAFFPGWDDNAY